MTYLSENNKLLIKFKAGHSHTLNQVYLHYAPMLYAFLRKGVTEREGERPYFIPGVDNLVDLEDILQETFLRAFSETARTNYDGTAPFRNYLFAIAKNVQLDRFRKQKTTIPVVSDNSNLTEQSTPETVSLSVLEKELQSLVKNYSRQLSGNSKEIFLAYFIQGQSLRQVAKSLGKTLMQVRHQVNKLTKSLRKYLIESGYDEKK